MNCRSPQESRTEYFATVTDICEHFDRSDFTFRPDSETVGRAIKNLDLA
jgi:hypothetical protein